MMNRYRRTLYGQGRTGGFTLVEIILVVLIIMILASVAGPRLVGKANQARVNTTKIAINGVKTALGNYEVQVGSFPTTAQGLSALVTRPSDVAEDQWKEKYIDDLPKDAWGREFKYECPSTHQKDYDLISAGKDGKFGTADDITNFDDKKSSGGSSSSSSSGSSN